MDFSPAERCPRRRASRSHCGRAIGFGLLAGAFLGLWVSSAAAHGPLFSPAPETIWKGGTEVTFGYRRGEAGQQRQQAGFLEAEYGLTSQWEIGVELPYLSREAGGLRSEGLGDLTLGTKYQFWRQDLPGAQYKAAGFLRVTLPTGDDAANPRLGSGSTDLTGGLVTGYESRRWYWFASGTYRLNSQGNGGLERGDEQSLNFVGGIRPVLSEYNEPDTVLMLELNWQRSDQDLLNGQSLVNTGGWELYASPVLWWTYRQVAVRGGIQIPLTSERNGNQPDSDYRAQLELIYHF